MVSDDTLRQLPFPYAVALRMKAAGHDDAAIAVAVGVEVQAVRILLELGEEKLAELRQDRGSAHHDHRLPRQEP